LQEHIDAFIAAYNETAEPFVWTKKKVPPAAVQKSLYHSTLIPGTRSRPWLRRRHRAWTCDARHHRFEGRFGYAAIGTVSNVASRLCDEAKPGQILISPRVLMAVEDAVTVEPVGEFELKGIRRPIAAYNVLSVASPNA
jgi:hypothetical protein